MFLKVLTWQMLLEIDGNFEPWPTKVSGLDKLSHKTQLYKPVDRMPPHPAISDSTELAEVHEGRGFNLRPTASSPSRRALATRPWRTGDTFQVD